MLAILKEGFVSMMGPTMNSNLKFTAYLSLFLLPARLVLGVEIMNQNSNNTLTFEPESYFGYSSNVLDVNEVGDDNDDIFNDDEEAVGEYSPAEEMPLLEDLPPLPPPPTYVPPPSEGDKENAPLNSDQASSLPYAPDSMEPGEPSAEAIPFSEGQLPQEAIPHPPSDLQGAPPDPVNNNSYSPQQAEQTPVMGGGGVDEDPLLTHASPDEHGNYTE